MTIEKGGSKLDLQCDLEHGSMTIVKVNPNMTSLTGLGTFETEHSKLELERRLWRALALQLAPSPLKNIMCTFDVAELDSYVSGMPGFNAVEEAMWHPEPEDDSDMWEEEEEGEEEDPEWDALVVSDNSEDEGLKK